MKLIPTVLCGGAGSRLWPVSRELHPKPFIRLADGQSLLQKAFLRGAALPDVAEILTVTNREFSFKTEDDFKEVNHKHLTTSFILEPFGRNTAAAITSAALHARKSHGDDAALLILPADHLIADQPAFANAVSDAMRLAQSGQLVTFGIQPHGPETGYGYIEADGTKVVRFVEKPSLERAREYVESGRFFWNSGMFCFTAGAILEEMQRLCPDVLSATEHCFDQSRLAEGKGFTQLHLHAECFKHVRDISIDFAVMEKSDKVAMVPCDIGWSDIGSWSALGDLTNPDAKGNRVEGKALLHNATNCYIRSHDRVIGVVGVEDVIIIDTPDALLVVDKSHAQDVKHLYARLKDQGHETYKHHRTVHRPWGTYTVLEEGEKFKIKRIVVKPGASLSLQMHRHRAEHWVVVGGTAKVVNGDNELALKRNESTYIPAGKVHRLTNPGTDDLVLIEVQSGDYLGEDDIVRLQDVYGRAA